MLNVQGGEYVFADNALGKHDGILEVVPFPGHEGNLHVLAEGKLTFFGSVAVTQNLPLSHLLAALNDWLQVYTSTLVGPEELDEGVSNEVVLEGDQAVFVGTFVTNDDLVGVYVFDNTVSFRVYEHAAVTGHLAFKARTHDGAGGAKQGNGLALHVRAHEGTVGIIVFQERNHGSGDTYNLVGGYVHELQVIRSQNGEVTVVTGFDLVVDKGTFLRDRGVGLGNFLEILAFGTQVDRVTFHYHLRVLYGPVGCFQEAHLIHFSVNTEGGDQTNVRSFRCFNRTQAAVVAVVNVSNLEAGTLTTQTARSEGGDTTLVRDLREWVRLVQELTQLAGTEERVDYAGEGPGVDQVNRGKYLVIADIHTLADRTGHPGQTYTELSVKLLTNCADAAVTQVIDIVNLSTLVHQGNQVLHDGDDVFLGQYQGFIVGASVQLAVDLVAAYFAKVVALVGEEQLVDDTTSGFFIGWITATKLAVDVLYGFDLAGGRVLL